MSSIATLLHSQQAIVWSGVKPVGWYVGTASTSGSCPAAASVFNSNDRISLTSSSDGVATASR